MRNSHIIVVFPMVLLMLCHVPAPAQQPLVLPDLSFKRLMNGLQITMASTPHLGGGMTIGVVVRYGSAFDPAGKGGLAHLVSRMFLKATLDKTLEDLNDELRYLGAEIEVQCDWDGFRFLLHGQASQYERSLLVLYQVLCEAQFNDEDFAGVREDILRQLREPEDPRQHIRRRFENILYKGTTYGRPLRGTEETVRDITIGDVRHFYRRYFSPDVSALVVVGPAPADLVLQKATRIWGVWVRRDEVPFTFLPPARPAGRSVLLEDDPASPAAQFILGNLWPRREEPVFYPAALAAGILQERLTKVLPTSLLTVHGEGRRMEGPFSIQGQAAADQASTEIVKIMESVEALVTGGVTEEELADAQKRLTGEFADSQRNTTGICSSILDSELYRLGTNYTAAFVDSIGRIRAGEVNRAAKEWFFPGGVIVVLRGSSAILKPALESLGTFQELSP